MNKTWIIFKNELITTLKRKGFILTTLSIPVLGLLGILIFQLVSGISQPPSETEVTRVGYVDQVGSFSSYTRQGEIDLVPYSLPEEANRALVEGQVQEYFIIPGDYIATGQITRYSTRTELEPPAEIMNAIRSFLISNLLEEKVSPDVAVRVQYPLGVSSIVLDETGAVSEAQGGIESMIIAYIFSLLLIMSIFTASGYLLQGLSEEKENRIMEILLSSVSTRQLITGKVLALGASGLIQIVVWLASGWGLLSIASTSIGGLFTSMQFPASVVALSLVYFILGYFLFAVLLAGIGAITPTQRDGQQMSVIITLLGASPYFLMTFIIENSQHIVSKIFTIFPLTAPLTVLMRVNNGIPVWELIASVVVLILSIIGCLFLVSRLFRVYLLMYGKTPGWQEILRSLRQA
jgi:ABC-2 type transport system permease protein